MILAFVYGFLMLLPSVAFGALSCGTVTTDITGTDRSSATIAYTPPSGSNQTLVVLVANRDSVDTVNSVTFNGVSMTEKIELHHSTQVTNAAQYYLKNPASGTHNVVVTWTGTATLASGVAIMTCTGSHADADPYRNAGTSAQTASDNTTLSTTVTDASGDLTIDVIAIDGNVSAPTEGANQTVIFAASPGSEMAMGASYQAGGLGGVMSWTWSTSNDATIVAAPLRAEASVNSLLLRRRVQ